MSFSGRLNEDKVLAAFSLLAVGANVWLPVFGLTMQQTNSISVLLVALGTFLKAIWPPVVVPAS